MTSDFPGFGLYGNSLLCAFFFPFPFLFHAKAASVIPTRTQPKWQRSGGNLGDFVGNFRENTRMFHPLQAQFLVNRSLIKPRWDPRNATWEGLRDNFTPSCPHPTLWNSSGPLCPCQVPPVFPQPSEKNETFGVKSCGFGVQRPRIQHLSIILADLLHPHTVPVEFLAGRAQMQQILFLPLHIQL